MIREVSRREEADLGSWKLGSWASSSFASGVVTCVTRWIRKKHSAHRAKQSFPRTVPVDISSSPPKAHLHCWRSLSHGSGVESFACLEVFNSGKGSALEISIEIGGTPIQGHSAFFKGEREHFQRFIKPGGTSTFWYTAPSSVHSLDVVLAWTNEDGTCDSYQSRVV